MVMMMTDSWIFKQLTDNGFRSTTTKETNIITLKSIHVAYTNKSARGKYKDLIESRPV